MAVDLFFLSGTVHIYSICRHLMACGHSSKVRNQPYVHNKVVINRNIQLSPKFILELHQFGLIFFVGLMTLCFTCNQYTSFMATCLIVCC